MGNRFHYLAMTPPDPSDVVRLVSCIMKGNDMMIAVETEHDQASGRLRLFAV